jgi:Transposase
VALTEKVWAGIDVGKEHHHCVVIDDEGRRLLSRRVVNNEPELATLIDEVVALADGQVLWAIDLNHGAAALVIGLLVAREQSVTYLTGLAIHRAAASYRSEAKTDARDAFIIADQARVRRDLTVLRPGDEIAVDLRILTTRRVNVVFDRTRQINRFARNCSRYPPHRIGTRIDTDQQRPAGAADRLPNPRGDPPRRVSRAWNRGCANSACITPPRWPRPR